jgi:hypothetical protein
MAKKRVQTIDEVLDAGPGLADLDAAYQALSADDGTTGEAEPEPERAPEPEVEAAATPEAEATEPEAEAQPEPPKLTLKLDADESAEPEPDAEPEWLTKQPEDVQKYVRELRSARDGQRHAYARRAEQVRTLQERLAKAELERTQAIHIALEGRKAQTPAASAPAAAALKAKIPLVIDDDTGEASLDPKVLEQLVDERARQIVAAQTGRQGAEISRVSVVDRMVSEAGITQDTQAALFSAWQDAQQLLQQASALEGGRPIAHLGEAKALLRKHQAEPLLQRKYPGLTLNDLFDVFEGSSDPENHGHRLIEVAQKAQARWFGANGSNGAAAPAKPAGPPKTPRPISDHPASMASRAPGSNARTGRDRATLDEIVAVNSVDSVLHMTDKDMDELVRRWESEIGESPSGFLR